MTVTIPYLLPDLPTADCLHPFLKEMDQNLWYSNFGPLEHQYKQALAQHFFNSNDYGYFALTSSGTSALMLALAALNLEPKSKVLIPSLTFPATALAVVNAGLTPVFGDTDENLELNLKYAHPFLINAGIKAVIPVSWHRKSLSIEDWDQFSGQTGIPVVIDAAPALEKRTLPKYCTLIFSLHATKNYGIGEGGIVVSPNKNMISNIIRLSNFGFDQGLVAEMGMNAKLSEYHAAVGLAQLDRYDQISARRMKMLQRYQLLLPLLRSKSLKIATNLNNDPCYLLLEDNNQNAKDVIIYMLNNGIECRRFYNPVTHLQPAFKHYHCMDDMAHTLRMQKSLITLPFHNYLSEEQINFIVTTLDNYKPQNKHRNSHQVNNMAPS